MESAIPPHLRTIGACPRRGYEAFSPPYPAFVARYPEGVNKVVMAYFGVQFTPLGADRAHAALARLGRVIGDPNGPRHHDRARYVDEAGFDTIITAAYWTDCAEFDLWFSSARSVWTGDDRMEEGVGTFVEVIRPLSDAYETLFSSLGRPEGVGALAPSFSGEIREHAYWGGMRDRLPRSYRSALEPAGPVRMWRDGPRIRVQANDNLCLIRSGQDWTDTTQDERELYMVDVEPVLRAGMDFLRDDGLAIGCFANRYMTSIDAAGTPIEKSYGLSFWRGLSDLERWAESHPTHVRIFGAAMKYLSSLGAAAKLRLYHEVTVVGADEQYFEYLNCHSRTGLLRAPN